MEIGKKVVTAGISVVLLGSISVYLLRADNTSAQNTASVQSPSISENSSSALNDQVKEVTHDSFVAAAEARREQQMEDKAEIERIEKLKKAKLNSVECKFWRQQQKTTSASAKIEEKINHHCFLPETAESSTQANDQSELAVSQSH